MNGDFIVTDGIYNFKYAGIVNKNFIIQPGGTIDWNGDPFNANIDVNLYSYIYSNGINDSIKELLYKYYKLEFDIQNDFLVVNCSDKIQSHIITAGRIHDCEYIDVIASLRNLEVLNIFTFATFKLEGSEQRQLSLKTGDIIQQLNELVPTGSDERIKISDIRVFFPSNDRYVPDGDFLSVRAAHSLIVIPPAEFIL